MNPSPEELRRRIDEALAEIEAVESDVIALFEGLGGPELAQRLLAFYEDAERSPRAAVLRERGSIRPIESRSSET